MIESKEKQHKIVFYHTVSRLLKNTSQTQHTKLSHENNINCAHSHNTKNETTVCNMFIAHERKKNNKKESNITNFLIYAFH